MLLLMGWQTLRMHSPGGSTFRQTFNSNCHTVDSWVFLSDRIKFSIWDKSSLIFPNSSFLAVRPARMHYDRLLALLSSLCPSACLWCCALWLNDTSYTVKVSDQVNRKCHPRHQLYNLQTHTRWYTYCQPSNSLPQNFQRSTIGYLGNS